MDEDREWAPDAIVGNEKAEFDARRNDLVGGRITSDAFRQFRLERGVYGQRQAGVQMVRFKIPYGGLTPVQLKRIAEISAQYGHGIVHLTTRQDVQLHYVRLTDITKIMDLLAAVDITTREACGNTVRNVTACPFAGICRDEVFDVTPHAHRTAQHLMRNPSTAGLGRKFKVAFSGCEGACGLAAIHDIGLVAQEREEDGRIRRGFKVLVGGGLGAAPKAAQVYAEFVPEEQLLPLCEAITRVFYLHGERDRRMKARMKFLLEDIGIEAFRELVAAELKGLTPEIAIEPLAPVPPVAEPTYRPASVAIDPRWLATNVYAQKQAGYTAVTVRLPLGDIAAAKLSELADFITSFTPEIRITVEQNLLLRWVAEERLADLYSGLVRLKLADAGAGRLIDVTACPGADTCNLGITSSKGLARAFSGELESALQRFADLDIRIKISGCPNSCGQHHIADIGFYGCSLRINGRIAPAFQMMLGGRFTGAGAEFAEPIMKVTSRRLPSVLAALLEHFDSERRNGDNFHEFLKRAGLDAIKSRLAPHAAAGDAPDVFQDWGGHSDFLLNVKQGECAGVQVDLTDALLARATAHAGEAESYFAAGEFDHAAPEAFSAVIQAAKAFLVTEGIHATSYHQILAEFDRRSADAFSGTGLPPDFRARVDEFKKQVPDHDSTERYLAFARSVVDAVHAWSQRRSSPSHIRGAA